MVREIGLCRSESLDPYTNLALEEWLLEQAAPGQCILYLWQNENTVVIGKNQNAWAECRVAVLEAEGGRVARRLSGGGAVFHDTGNLNFTFLMPEELYDLDRQLLVIQEACRLAGIPTERSGRNDLTTGGRKFSGNAFYHAGGKAYHHGTLLIHVDGDKLQRYLSPSKAKLEAKGVKSVRSRVVNLQELVPELTCSRMASYLEQAFAQVYGLEPRPISVPGQQVLEPMRSRLSSWDYLYGRPLPFSFQCQGRWPWGGLELQLRAEAGLVTAVQVYTDAMDHQLPRHLEQALLGCRFDLPALQRALEQLPDPEVRRDLQELLAKSI